MGRQQKDVSISGIYVSAVIESHRRENAILHFALNFKSSCVDSVDCPSFELYTLIMSCGRRQVYLSSLTAELFSFSCSSFPFALVVHPPQSLSL